jgi:hypothetical protein
MDVYRSLIHNCQNLEATKDAIQQVNKQTEVQTNSEILFSTKEK